MAPTETAPHADVLARVVRDERGRLLATLVRRYGFDLAEECLDTAVESALRQWPTDGVPASPRAWLLSVARRRAVDVVRHRAMADEAHRSLRVVAPEEDDSLEDPARHLPDDRLRLLFTCCHPALAQETQVALALRWLSGLSTEDVARAFCVPVPTMAQRLTRAKSKIEGAGIPYTIPERAELPERLAAVLDVVYAIFNEGYVATAGERLQRVDLAEEAVRLAELVVALLPDRADGHALLALILFVHARREARASADGELVALEAQDRSRWDTAAIVRAKEHLAASLQLGAPTAYTIEAAIQALHDEAPRYADTDFAQIAALYALLAQRVDAPVVRLNAAVARAMVDGPAAALADVDGLAREEALATHPALHAARADLLRRLGRASESAMAYERAIAATRNEAERRFLTRRRDALREG
jgi:RNA polymerase sigma-70 factor (ECF subfamily)